MTLRYVLILLRKCTSMCERFVTKCNLSVAKIETKKLNWLGKILSQLAALLEFTSIGKCKVANFAYVSKQPKNHARFAESFNVFTHQKV